MSGADPAVTDERSSCGSESCPYRPGSRPRRGVAASANFGGTSTSSPTYTENPSAFVIRKARHCWAF
jgi:hypothetical protein